MSFRSYLTNSPNVLSIWRAVWGEKFLMTLALMWDSFVQMLVDASRSSWLAENDGPAYDALRPLGQDRSIKQFPNENWVQYRGRLQDAWTTWSRAGSFSIIVEQLEIAGFPGAVILRTGLTEFDVIFPVGTHSVGPAPTYGSGTYGGGLVYGPTGITAEELSTIRGIIKQWKAHNWVCRKVTWIITGTVYGLPGVDYGDPGVLYGSSIVSVGVY